jgi:3-keto-disaccharide hydrolase
MMNRKLGIAFGVLLAGAAALGISHQAAAQAGAGWVQLFNGQNLANWNRIGDANWTVDGGVITANKGGGFLVSKESYGDFQIRAQFWTDTPANSGIFIRCDNPAMVGAQTCYEVNIFDTRPEADYGTGAIVNTAKVSPPYPKAANQWNYMEIEAKGDQFTITFNGVRTVDRVRDSKHARGVFGLQYGAGVVKFRNVQIRPI